MSVFANALESADTTVENDAAAAATPEDETATSVISSTADAAQEVAQESADLDQLGSEQEELGEVQETIEQESAGLSPEAARYLNIALNRIVGKRAANKIIATENYSTGRAAQESAKRFALESISETLKSFWEAIKAQLKKFYAKVKTFFVKMFSGAKKLKERAEKIQKKANDTVGSIEEKSFSFSQTKTIAVDGKYNEPSTVLGGLGKIRTTVEGTITVKKSDDYETAIDNVQRMVETAITGFLTTAKTKRAVFDGSKVTGNHSKIIAELDKVSGIAAMPGKHTPEEKLGKMYSDVPGAVDMSDPLPGGKALFVVSKLMPGKTDKGLEALKMTTKIVKDSRIVLGADKYTPREVSEGDVKTLTTSQIDKLCDDVIEIAEISYLYEKAWERREKFQAKLEREIDQIIKDVDQEDDDKLDSTFKRVVSGYAEAFTANVRRRTTFESQLISYSLLTSNAFLNYAEKSLSQHKAK